MAGASLVFDILARDRASSALSKIGNEASKTQGHFSKLGSTLSTGLKWGAVAAGGAAVAGVGAVFKAGVGEVEDYQKGLAQLQQGLKTTGNAAGISAQGMEDLASKIQGYSGQTDDSIVATEQLLLTFTNIRNEAGKGNDVFTQTTKIAADMAARLGGDASGAAIQLGKALNDPVKGITALQRVGVSFSAQQKKQIKGFVDSGHTMKAQKIILAELNKEFGGSAKAVGNTLPGQIEKAKRKFEDFAQGLASVVLPLLFKLGGFVGKVLSPITSHLGDVFYYLQTAFDAVSVGFANQGPIKGATGIFRTIETVVGSLVNVFQHQLVPAFRQVAQFVATNVVPILKAIASFIYGQVVPAVVKLVGVLVGALRGALRTVNAAIASHREQLTGIFNAIKTVAGFILRVAVPVIGIQLKVAFKVLGTAIAVIITVLADLFGASRSVVRFFGGPFVHAIGVLVATFVKGFKYIADVWFSVVGALINGGAKAFGWLPFVGKKLQKAAKAFDGFRHDVDGSLSAVAADAESWGEKTGAGLATGIIGGMDAHWMDVYIKARKLGGMSAKAVQYGAQVRSPSKITTWVGKMLAQGLLTGFSGESGHVLNGMTHAMQKMLSALGDRITKEMDRINARVGAARDRLSAVRSDKRQFAGGIAQSLTGDLSGAFDSDGKLGSVSGFLSSTASGLKRFAGQLRKLRGMGLSAGLLAQIANLGVDQGGQVAQQLLTGGVAGITATNRAERQVNQFAGQAGATVANATFAGREARAEQHLAAIRHAAHDQVHLLREIARKVGANPDAAEITRDLRRYKRQTGHALGLA